MVYNSKHICTYQYYDSRFKNFILNIDTITEEVEQSEDTADLIYKSDMLQVFNLTEYDDDKIHEEMINLFEVLKNNEKMVECMKKMALRFVTEELELGMMLLFSYDTFFVMNLCICDIMEKGDIEEENMNLLVKLIN
jgi:hypothetical protein|uniref:Uncharacterized protein n=1 Tax=viral metagenome TaxID=1070528 RepID=A0A6C0CV27_9ZZZZ